MENFKEFLSLLKSCDLINEASILIPPIPKQRLKKEYYYNPNVYNGSPASTEGDLYPNKRDLPVAPPSALLGLLLKKKMN
jgi:hypothetical protein